MDTMGMGHNDGHGNNNVDETDILMGLFETHSYVS